MKRYTDSEKQTILEYIREHGFKQGAVKYGVSYCAYKTWQTPAAAAKQQAYNNESYIKRSSSRRLAVINCASLKKTYACEAKQMYDDSPLFRVIRDYVELAFDAYLIVSAHYGLLSPEQVIEPYGDVVMFKTSRDPVRRSETKRLSATEKNHWAQAVINGIEWEKYSEVVFIVGVEYWKPIESHMSDIHNAKRLVLPSGIGNAINFIKQKQNEFLQN